MSITTPKQLKPGQNARPGRPTRSTVYPAFTRTGPLMPEEGTKPIYLYLRLSKYHKDKADAIERQRVDLTRKLHAEGGWTIMGEYVDNDSASKSAARTRKGWKQLNTDIEESKVTALAFWKLDRTNRIASQCIEWVANCQKVGVYLVSHQDSAEELNTATAGAKLITGIKALLAEVETDSMSERQLASKRHLAEAGFTHGGMRPFGWQSGPRITDELGRTGKRLIPHPIEFPALKDSVEMVLAGKSLTQVTQHWRDAYDITTAEGGLVYQSTAYRALVSPRMVGYRMRNVPEHERRVKINLIDYIARDADGNPVIGMEPVCDYATWRKVCYLLEQAKTSKSRTPWGSHEWLLSGLAYCACGNAMYGQQRSGPSHGKPKEYLYRCKARRYKAEELCDVPAAIMAGKIEAYVTGWFFSQITDKAIAKARARRRAAKDNEALDALLAEKDEAIAERQVLVEKQGSGEYRGAMVTALLTMIEGVQVRIDRLQAQIDSLEVTDLPPLNGPEVVAAWETTDLREKRLLLRRVIQRVEVTPGRAPVQERVRIIPVP